MLAHELSHVAHRDVLVMTLASSAAIVTGMAMRGAQWGGLMGGFGRRDNNNGVPMWLVILVVSIVVYAVSFLAIKLLSRYRELAADRAGAYLTGDPSALARRADQDQRADGRDPAEGPAPGGADERVLHRARRQRSVDEDPHRRRTPRSSSD